MAPSWALPRRRSTTRSTGRDDDQHRLGAALGLGPRHIIDELGSRNELWLEDYRVKTSTATICPGPSMASSPPVHPPGALPATPWSRWTPTNADQRRCPLRGRARPRMIDDRSHPGDGPAGRPVDQGHNFCTMAFLFGITKRGGMFVTRQHASTLNWEPVGKRVSKGRCETGDVFEQKVRLTNDEGEILFAWRITVELDQATRDGDRTIHILTNLPKEKASAIQVADCIGNVGRWKRLPRAGGVAPRRDQRAGLSQGRVVRPQHRDGLVQRAEHREGGRARFTPRRPTPRFRATIWPTKSRAPTGG